MELSWDGPGATGGLDEAMAPELGAGVRSAVDLAGFNVFGRPWSNDLLAGVTESACAADRFWKKPAMLLCFPPFEDCMADELPVFPFGGGRGVAISLPSMPRAISCFLVVQVDKKGYKRRRESRLG